MLNMRSPDPDLTTRARIRDAALALFGASGPLYEERGVPLDA